MTPEPLDEAGPDPIVLLEASRPLGAWTRYEDQIFAAIPDDITVRFTGGTAALADVDVLHSAGSLDRLLGIPPRTTPLERLKKTQRFVRQLEDSGVALVRTVYGPQRPVADARLAEAARLLDEATSTFIAVDETTETPDSARTVMIPFVDLADRFAGYPVNDQVTGRILSVAPNLLGEAASGVLKTSFLTRVPGLSVRSAGKADADFVTLLETATARTPQVISSRLEPLSDAALVEELTAAELVVVPAPATLPDLHVLMMALAFGRAVLVPTSPAMTALAAEVGAGWVVTYDGPITAEVLDDAMTTVRAAERAPRPDLSARGWDVTGRRYAEAFRTAALVVREACVA